MISTMKLQKLEYDFTKVPTQTEAKWDGVKKTHGNYSINQFFLNTISINSF